MSSAEQKRARKHATPEQITLICSCNSLRRETPPKAHPQLRAFRVVLALHRPDHALQLDEALPMSSSTGVPLDPGPMDVEDSIPAPTPTVSGDASNNNSGSSRSNNDSNHNNQHNPEIAAGSGGAGGAAGSGMGGRNPLPPPPVAAVAGDRAAAPEEKAEPPGTAAAAVAEVALVPLPPNFGKCRRRELGRATEGDGQTAAVFCGACCIISFLQTSRRINVLQHILTVYTQFCCSSTDCCAAVRQAEIERSHERG